MANIRTVLTRAGLITAVAEIATIAVFVTMRWLGVEAIEPREWIETLIIPLLVGMPIASYVVVQADRLRAANDQMATLNEAREQSLRQLQQAHDLISYAARHDRMTGLLNREGFMADLSRAHDALEQSVLLIVDADFFKSINDRFGHAAGDSALIAIATAIQRAVRPMDLVGRIGGEEFGILVRHVSTSVAAEVSEKVRLEVAETVWGPDEQLPISLSVSIGGAAIRDFADSVTALMIHADACLYEAKRLGRNRIAFNATISDMARSMVTRLRAIVPQ
ncbi:MAG: GGDEF domain-containing protein [Devosia sp.]